METSAFVQHIKAGPISVTAYGPKCFKGVN